MTPSQDRSHHPPTTDVPEPAVTDPVDASEVSEIVDGPRPVDDAGAAAAADADTVQDAEQAETGEDADTEVDDLTLMKNSLADLTNDLQRLQAEYANYRKRVDRDRQVVAENAAYKALTPVIEVLDAIDRAKEHDEVEGGFKAVADQLERAVATSGLVRFGEPGEAFDPNVHDALSHMGTDAEVTVTTIKHVAKAGYRMGERVVRAAQVLVVDPAED